jgi:hypothetical protein
MCHPKVISITEVKWRSFWQFDVPKSIARG